MGDVNITTSLTLDLSMYLGSVSTNKRSDIDEDGRSPFHQLIYIDDMENAYFNLNEFAESVSYYHTTLQRWETYPALFDDPHTSFSMGPETEVTNLRPQIMISEGTLKHLPTKGDKCRVRNIEYHVDDSHKDGVGVITIFFRVN